MIFLYDTQSPVNIGLIFRIAEQFQSPVAVFDPRGILADPQKIPTISDFACGALTRRPPTMVNSLQTFHVARPGRIVATCLAPGAVPLSDFIFEDGDTVVFGNEYDGLPDGVIARADVKLYIPLPQATLPKPRSFSPIDPARSAEVSQNGIPNLNVSTAVAIIAYEWHMQKQRRLVAGEVMRGLLGNALTTSELQVDASPEAITG